MQFRNKLANSVHTPHTNDVAMISEFVHGTCFGTRFDLGKDNLRACGFEHGWNKLDDGTFAWFDYVGCHGYEFIQVTKNQRKQILRRVRELQRTPRHGWRGSKFWDYTNEDRHNFDERCHDTCVRNKRLAKRNFVNFAAHLISGIE